MKRLLIFFSLTLSVCLGAQAQHWSVGTSYGVFSTLETMMPASKAWGVPGAYGSFTPTSTRTIGAFSLDFRHDWPNRVFIGAGLAVQNIEYHGTGTGTTDVKRWSNSLTIHGGFRYLDRPSIGMYSGLGMGVAIFQDDMRDLGKDGAVRELDVNMGYQLTLVGMRAGRTFHGYLELGYGYQGMVCAGVGYRWPRQKKSRTE